MATIKKRVRLAKGESVVVRSYHDGYRFNLYGSAEGYATNADGERIYGFVKPVTVLGRKGGRHIEWVAMICKQEGDECAKWAGDGSLTMRDAVWLVGQVAGETFGARRWHSLRG